MDAGSGNGRGFAAVFVCAVSSASARILGNRRSPICAITTAWCGGARATSKATFKPRQRKRQRQRQRQRQRHL